MSHEVRPDIDDISIRLVHVNDSIRYAANAQLHTLDAQTQNTVLKRLIANFGQLEPFTGWSYLQGGCTLIIGLAVMSNCPRDMQVVIGIWSSVALALHLYLRYGVGALHRRTRGRFPEILPLFTGIDDVCILDGLSMAVREYGMTADFEQAFIRLLPRVNAENERDLQINRAELRSLLVLDPVEHADLVIAIMNALTRLRDTTSIANIRKFTAIKATTSETIRIQTAAIRCLGNLETKRQHNLLLRPSQDPNPSATLLRPAANAPSDERVLLRPAEEPTANDEPQIASKG